jgi:hypothetical protein
MRSQNVRMYSWRLSNLKLLWPALNAFSCLQSFRSYRSTAAPRVRVHLLRLFDGRIEMLPRIRFINASYRTYLVAILFWALSAKTVGWERMFCSRFQRRLLVAIHSPDVDVRAAGRDHRTPPVDGQPFCRVVEWCYLSLKCNIAICMCLGVLTVACKHWLARWQVLIVG